MDCLKNFYGDTYDYYSRFPYSLAVRMYLHSNRQLEIIELRDGTNWYHCIEGHYEDPDILRMELRKRWLKKQQEEIS